MKIVLDYMEGKISFEEFGKAFNEDPTILEWLDSLIDLKSDAYKNWEDLPFPEFRIFLHKHYNGSIKQLYDKYPLKMEGHKVTLLEKDATFSQIAAIIVVAFPYIKLTTYYNDEYRFYNDVVSSYFGGNEVDGLIEETLKQFPSTMGKTARKKAAKAAIKELFHIQGNRYPIWVQEPEWPMGKCSPMAYLDRKRDGELVIFTFQDVDTLEIREVEQLY